MKTSFWIKLLLVLPFLLITDYLLMVILGCASCLFGLGDDYYCGGYCLIGKLILLISGIFFIFLIYPEIKHIIRKDKKSQQNSAEEPI